MRFKIGFGFIFVAFSICQASAALNCTITVNSVSALSAQGTSAVAGATICVSPGIYNLSSLTTSVSGTASARIRFISTTQWGAHLIGTSDVWINTGNYIDIVGFEIDGTGGSAAHGILNQGSNVRILGNHVHDIPAPGGCSTSGGAGIDNANYSAADNDVIGNSVHAIGISQIPSCSMSTIQGIYHANLRGKIENNIVYYVQAIGISLWHAANNVVIDNNTVFNCGYPYGTGLVGGGIWVGDGDLPGGVSLNYSTISNNIVYKNSGIGIRELGSVGNSNQYFYNLNFQNGLNAMMISGTLLYPITQDPDFVNYQPTGGDVHLLLGSPAIGGGSDTPDFAGSRRPVDVGAFVYDGALVAWPWY